MEEEIIAKGKIFELVQIPKSDGKVFEVARRTPGVRLIIVDTKVSKVLLSKEFRYELKDWDYRLPGGKVFDTLDEFEAWRKSGTDLDPELEKRVKIEAHEEVGIDVVSCGFFKKSTLGATVEWDLYVYVVKDWKVHHEGQNNEAGEFGEKIENDNWFSFSEAEDLILKGKMQEERMALVLLQWLKRQ